MIESNLITQLDRFDIGQMILQPEYSLMILQLLFPYPTVKDLCQLSITIDDFPSIWVL